jgi:hypothetical protein
MSLFFCFFARFVTVLVGVEKLLRCCSLVEFIIGIFFIPFLLTFENVRLIALTMFVTIVFVVYCGDVIVFEVLVVVDDNVEMLIFGNVIECGLPL